MTTPDQERHALGESVATVAWFLLDASWLFEWRWAAAVAGAIAIGAAAWSARYAERDAGSVAVAVGVLGWVLMNAAWVIGDLNKLPWAIALAKVFAALVAACLLAALAASRGTREALEQLLLRLRRLRL